MFSLSLFGNNEYFFSQRFHWDETCTLIFQQYLGRRQQQSKNNGKRQVESYKDLLQASATETPDTVKETSSWLDQANYKSVLPEW